MIVRVASFLNLAGPDLIVIAIIIAVLAAPSVIALPIVFYLERRRKKLPPLPTVSQSTKQ
jgi:hypothetical protein